MFKNMAITLERRNKTTKLGQKRVKLLRSMLSMSVASVNIELRSVSMEVLSNKPMILYKSG